MKRHILFASSTLVAGAIAVALILRPNRSILPDVDLPAPERLSPALRGVIKSKMTRHAEQLATLMSRVVALDYEGVARAAGAIYDEPTLARPLAGDELNGALPERFFILQDALRAQAQTRVDAAARKETRRIAESSATKRSCVGARNSWEAPPRRSRDRQRPVR